MHARTFLTPSFALLSTASLEAQSPAAKPSNDPTLLESVTITANRNELPLGDVSQRVTLIGPLELERTPANYVTDMLKKNAQVDVIGFADLGEKPGDTSLFEVQADWLETTKKLRCGFHQARHPRRNLH